MTPTLAQLAATVHGGALLAALAFTLALTLKSVRDYTTAGPMLPDEVVRRFRGYAVWALARLAVWALLVAGYWALAGALWWQGVATLLGHQTTMAGVALAAALAIAGATLWRFVHALLHNPGLIVASSHYRISRFYPLWARLSPARLRRIEQGLLVAGLVPMLLGALAPARTGDRAGSLLLLATLALLLGLAALASQRPRAPARQGRAGSRERPNLLLIGCDTLRADWLGCAGHPRGLTPNIDALAAAGTQFAHCYVPCGRTAPSLISLLTGTWPQTHGIRDNFVADAATRLRVPSLPRLLGAAGYRSEAISDWCGADLGKFDFGFDRLDLPDDSWNLRYLLRQGPKDLRLFLSLFLHNRLGKRLLPEVYYLGGVPSTSALGAEVRARLSRLAEDERPFLLNAFFSTTHPPFACEHPYYARYAEPGYSGPSKFAMARLTDPFEIIRRQGEPRREFDLDQILRLYDGCVKRFDDEVGAILEHLEHCGLADRTLVAIYSDHGMEFFEHDTWGQGNSVLSDHSARIPLIVRDPLERGGHRIEGIVRSVDLAPTLLERCGLRPPPAMDGVSLAACLGGAPAPALTAYTESGIWLTDLPGMPEGHLRYPDLLGLLDVPDHRSGTLAIRPEYADLVVRAKDRMVREGRWKLTYQPLVAGAIWQLFDLERDPDCRHDRAAAHPEVVARLRARLQPWLH
ncbi:sulfatase [Marichromatium sp. PS1]|uniref:sulfatase family protein n=1 Tax=Marichromatium sp. PS1 TaxID=3138932 RepID=UPI0034E885AF